MGALRGTDGDRAVKRRRLHGAVAAGVILSLTLSACGGSDGDGGDGGGSGGVPERRLALRGAAPLLCPQYRGGGVGDLAEGGGGGNIIGATRVTNRDIF